MFASTSDPSVAHPDPKKLPQNTMVELLSFEKYVHGRCRSLAHFCETKLVITSIIAALEASFHSEMVDRYLCSELKQFKENNGGSPDYTINMCFGEKFPDGKALEKKLIVVKVTLFPNFPELHSKDTLSI